MRNNETISWDTIRTKGEKINTFLHLKLSPIHTSSFTQQPFEVSSLTFLLIFISISFRFVSFVSYFPQIDHSIMRNVEVSDKKGRVWETRRPTENRPELCAKWNEEGNKLQVCHFVIVNFIVFLDSFVWNCGGNISSQFIPGKLSPKYPLSFHKHPHRHILTPTTTRPTASNGVGEFENCNHLLHSNSIFIWLQTGKWQTINFNFLHSSSWFFCWKAEVANVDGQIHSGW